MQKEFLGSSTKDELELLGSSWSLDVGKAHENQCELELN